MSKENRAFDTQQFGKGYGFESHPRRAVEMPPIWVLLVGLGFLLLAAGFWVCNTST
jgi:dolichyl-phosphate beta-glucosyltransferase